MINESIKQNQKNILNLLEKKGDARILDLGCDDGIWTLKLAKKIETNNIYGVEIIDERIKIAKKNNIKIVETNLNDKLPFEDNFFNVIHSNQVIEHLTNTDTFVAEIYRILKPNGYAIISTENLSSWHNIFALIFGFQPFSMTNFSQKGTFGNPFSLWNGDNAPKIKYPDSWQHNRLFSYYGLKDLFQKYNFKILKIKTSGYYPLWGWLSNIDPIHGHWITIKISK